MGSQQRLFHFICVLQIQTMDNESLRFSAITAFFITVPMITLIFFMNKVDNPSYQAVMYAEAVARKINSRILKNYAISFL
jgi:hypothetical protein